MKKYLDKLFAGMVAFSAYQIFLYWLDRRGYLDLYNVATSQEMRPFVYRVLLPLLARALDQIFRIGPVPALAVVVIFFSVATYYSIKLLSDTFLKDERGSLVAFLACEALFIVLIQESKVYDLATPGFFALSLWTLAHRRFWSYYILFPLATLNRETTFLVSLFYAAYYVHGPISRRHWFYGCVYQGLAYFLIRMFTMAGFADLPGAPFILSWRHVLNVYAAYLPLTLAFGACLAIISYFILRGWTQKPVFLRFAFLTIFPVQLGLHLTLGWPYELRVFAESIPIIALLATCPTRSVNRQLLARAPQSRQMIPSRVKPE